MEKINPQDDANSFDLNPIERHAQLQLGVDPLPMTIFSSRFNLSGIDEMPDNFKKALEERNFSVIHHYVVERCLSPGFLAPQNFTFDANAG